jgi:hypothetical protein
MAASRHSLSRRALLGAGAAFGVLPGVAHAGPSGVARALADVESGEGAELASPARWVRALAGYRRAEAKLAAFGRDVERLPPEARAYPACAALDDRFGDLESARLARLERLLGQPAPDLPAFALKVELLIGDQAWELPAAALSLPSSSPTRGGCAVVALRPSAMLQPRLAAMHP